MLKDHLHLHFIVLLFGFTAILGKLISINATELVCYRMLLAALGIGAYAAFKKNNLRLPTNITWQLIGVGAIVALHWVTFFGAVKVSNVSVTLGCMASATLFTSFLEPLLEKRRIFWVEVLIGVLIIIGLYVITQFAMEYYLGIILALTSAFLASLFGVLNRRFVQTYPPAVISFYEMSAGFVLLFIYSFFTADVQFSPLSLSLPDAGYLLVLAWLCTSYAFVGVVYLMKRMSAYTVSLAINMEPVYGILLALLIFGKSEHMHRGFYVGALIIIATISVYPSLKKRFGETGD